VTALALDGLEAQLPVLAADELERERAAVAVAGAVRAEQSAQRVDAVELVSSRFEDRGRPRDRGRRPPEAPTPSLYCLRSGCSASSAPR